MNVVDTAFLYAKLKEELYMLPPEGMEGIPEGKVLRLLKSSYGSKQSPMNFNNTINECIESMGFKRCVSVIVFTCEKKRQRYHFAGIICR
jgi:hypothetical protein